MGRVVHGDRWKAMLLDVATSTLLWLQQMDQMTGAAAFYLFFVGWTMLCLPSTVVEISAGFLFPYPLALAVDVAGKSTGACISFQISRALGHRVQHWLSTAQGRLLQLQTLIAHSPFTASCVIRAAPLPAPLKNYGMGLLPPSLLSTTVYNWSTFLTGIPFSMIWCYLGNSASSLQETLSGEARDKLPIRTIAPCVALLLLLVLTTRAAANYLAAAEPTTVAAKHSAQAAACTSTAAESPNPFRVVRRKQTT